PATSGRDDASRNLKFAAAHRHPCRGDWRRSPTTPSLGATLSVTSLAHLPGGGTDAPAAFGAARRADRGTSVPPKALATQASPLGSRRRAHRARAGDVRRGGGLPHHR